MRRRRWSALYCAATVAELDGDFAGSESLAAQALSTFVAVSPDRAHAAYFGQSLPLDLRQGRLSELAPTVRADIARHLTAALDLAPDDFTWLTAHVVGGRAAAMVGDGALLGGDLPVLLQVRQVRQGWQQP